MVNYALDSISFQTSVTVPITVTRTLTITANTQGGLSVSFGTTLQLFDGGTPNFQPRLNPFSGTVTGQVTTSLPIPRFGPLLPGVAVNPFCGTIGPSLGIPGLISAGAAVNFGGC
jgi:hypothetical protein